MPLAGGVEGLETSRLAGMYLGFDAVANAGHSDALLFHVLDKLIWVQPPVTCILEVPGCIINGSSKSGTNGQQATD